MAANSAKNVRRAVERAAGDGGSVKTAAAVAGAAVVAASAAAGAKAVRGRKQSRAFRVKAKEDLPEAVARIARGRIDHALDELQGKSKRSPDEAVHEARKDMKKLRAVLRLSRSELGDERYREENAIFRDAARGLSGVRDAQVVIETVDKLAKSAGKDLPKPPARALRSRLVERRKALASESDSRGDAAREAIVALKEARDRIGEWPLETEDFDAVEPGLRRIYRQGRRRFAAARKEPSDENLHEWRKRVKDLWYHHQLLRFVWPAVMEPAADEAHRLSELLGDDHDLAVLDAAVEEHADAVPEPADRAALHEAVGKRRGELQAEALELGERIYAEKPRAFTGRLRGWYEAARLGRGRSPCAARAEAAHH